MSPSTSSVAKIGSEEVTSSTARIARSHGGYLLPAVEDYENVPAANGGRAAGLFRERARQLQLVQDGAYSSGRVVPLATTMHAVAERREQFRSLAHWEGVVLTVSDGGFIASLTSAAPDEPAQEAEFDWDDVPTGDHDLVAEGAVFYWSIGYVDSAGGQRSRSSMLRFRRLPMWTEEELDAARRAAEHAAQVLDWD